MIPLTSSQPAAWPALPLGAWASTRSTLHRWMQIVGKIRLVQTARVRPGEAFYSARLGWFLLPYDDVRLSKNPDAVLLDFLQSTYEAAARLGRWDREALERRSTERSRRP